MKTTYLAIAAAVVLLLGSASPRLNAQRKPAPPTSVRVYVFDCGKLESADPSRFSLKREEMATTDMSVACYLVVHPRGTLMWDVGAVPDGDVTSPGTTTRYHIVLPNGNERFVTTTQTLKTQLAATGYAPGDINFLALSHYHYDHTGQRQPVRGRDVAGRGRSNATSCFRRSRTT